MIPIAANVRVWIATGHTDMRRGMVGMALQVQDGLKRDPHAGDLYVFRGKRGDLVTNAETGECFERAYKVADKQLNIVYQQSRSVLIKADQDRLELAQTAWLRFRDASCEAERDLYRTGTGANPEALACLEAETRNRTVDLHQSYGWKLQQAGL